MTTQGFERGDRASGGIGGSGSGTSGAALDATRASNGESAPRQRHFFNSLFFRIGALNLVGLLIFMGGLLASTQYRKSTVDERLLALETHATFIAGALEQTALVPRPGQQDGQPFDAIDQGEAVDVLRRLILPTNLRARIYDYDGRLIYDSELLDEDAQVDARSLDDPDPAHQTGGPIDDFMMWLMGPTLTPWGADARMPHTEVTAALGSRAQADARKALRRDDDGNLIVSVAMPVKKLRAHVGALLLSTQGGDFDAVLRAERGAIFQIFAIALGANLLIALFYAGTVVRPIRRLADAADKIRYARQNPGTAARAEIPGYYDRRDEIGDLAASLNDMTRALNARLDAIEQFAADVAHEIKTPLTSLRSAVETFDLAKTEQMRARLLAVVKHDVDRLDRLITDISNASRLDAELSREDAETVNIPALLQNILQVYVDSGTNGDVALRLDTHVGALDRDHLSILGLESRIGQVVQNLVDNAVSFSPPGGTVRLVMGMERHFGLPFVSVRIEDEGPGIPEDSLERIFERFYTQRPSEEDFGQNSGLGLSISKQIIEAHNGRIWAENRRDDHGRVLGARFTFLIPAHLPGKGR